jgi:glycerol-1-phosphate dehydrogenase [NAD(P)+]
MSLTEDPHARVPLDLDAVRASLGSSAELEPIGMAGLIIGPAALDRLGEVLSGALGSTGRSAGEVVVLAAATPMTVCGAALRDSVTDQISAHYGLEWTVLGAADGSVHADEHTVAAARKAASGAGGVVTVGSGTITDIGKAAASPGTPLVAVQTATSVNGYADPFSVLLTAGVKRTTPTRWPGWLIADTDVLADAPDRLNLAGVGDMAAMFTATAVPGRAAWCGRPGVQRGRGRARAEAR